MKLGKIGALFLLNDVNNLSILIMSLLIDINNVYIECYLIFCSFSLVYKKK